MRATHLTTVILLLAGCAAWAGPGDNDPTFQVSADATVRAMAVQADGKILLGGDFVALALTSHNHLGRLNPNGTLDAAFTAFTDGSVAALAALPDGRILIGGSFNSAGGFALKNVGRLNASGTVDARFDPGTGPNAPVLSVAAQQDDKVLVGGQFTAINGIARNFIARLNSDGSLDPTFNNGSGPNNTVLSVAIQVDGKILIGGSFLTVNGASRPFVARLNSDQSLDASFNPGSGPNAGVNCLLLQGDGKVLIGGSFSTVNSVSRKYVARLNTDGTLDTNFNWAGNGSACSFYSLATQADGKVLAGGYYSSAASFVPFLTRLNANGSQDSTFAAFSGLVASSSQAVLCLALQTDGKALMGGSYATQFPFPGFLARLRSDAPFIDNQPSSQTVLPGGTATFTVSVSGAAPFSYQWRKDGTNLSGATLSSLTLTNAGPSQTGNYQVVVTNNAGSATSASAALSLYGAPLIKADGQVVAGTTVRNYSSSLTFETAFPGGYIFYTLDGTPPSFSSPLFSGPILLTDSATVRALSLSSDFTGSFPSPPARIQILKNTLLLSGGGGYISAVPSQPLYERGTPVTLTAIPDSGWNFDRWAGDVSGATNPITIAMNSTQQVQAVFTTSVLSNIVGSGHIELSSTGAVAYGASLQLRAVPDHGNIFVVWGEAVSGTNNPLTFTVNVALPTLAALFSAAPVGTPIITVQPTNQSTTLGASVTFSVAASGASSYQWRLNGASIPGATAATLTLTNLSPMQAGDYDVLVAGTAGSILSAPAKLVLMDFDLRPVVSVLGSPGTHFRVEYTDNLTNGVWLELTNAALSSSRQDIIDFSSTNTQQRFYRVVLP